MASGKYRDRITIQQVSGTADEYGNIDLDDDSKWSELTTRRANIVSRGGKEFWRAGQVQEEVSHIVTIRSDSTTRTVTSKMRATWESKTLQIVAAHEGDDRQREIVLLCKE